jgi:hypothetical protein
MKISTSIKIFCTAAWLTLAAAPATAAPILTDLPADTYITVGNLNWTWASPVSSVNFGGNVLSGPSLHAGWRFATEAEFAARPVADDFIVDSITRHSAAYWNSQFDFINFGNGENGLINRVLVADNDSTAFYEMWYVRDVRVSVPEPATWAFMIFGFAAIGGSIWRQRKTNVNNSLA